MDAPAISRRHFLGDLLACQTGNRMRGGDLHLLVDCGGTDIKRTTENKREAQHIVDLVRIIRPTRRDDAVGAHRFGGGRRDFGIGIGHRKDDRFLRHFRQERRGQRILCGQAKKHVGAVKCFFERATVGLGGMGRFPLVHAFGAALIDDARPVAHDDIVMAHAHCLDQRGAGDGGGSRAVDDDLDVLHLAPGQVHGIDQARRRDDRGAVLVIVHDGDFHPLFQCLLDNEAFGRLDVLEVDAAKARFKQGDGFDEFVGIFGSDFEIDRIDVGKAFEEDRLALHHRLRCERTEIAEAKDRRAVRDDGDQIALGRIVIGRCRVGGDGEHGDRNTRRVSEAQVTLRRHWLGRDDLDLSGPPLRMEQQGFAVGKLDVRFVAHACPLDSHWAVA